MPCCAEQANLLLLHLDAHIISLPHHYRAEALCYGGERVCRISPPPPFLMACDPEDALRMEKGLSSLHHAALY